jgi:hypothetical protein
LFGAGADDLATALGRATGERQQRAPGGTVTATVGASGAGTPTGG